MRSSFLAILVALTANAATAEATRPLVRTATAIKNLRLSMPMAMEKAELKDFLGIDMEEPAVRQTILKQADDYIQYRRGKLGSENAGQWLVHCETNLGKADENPFCHYEFERHLMTAASGASQSRRPAGTTSSDREFINARFKDGRFEQLSNQSQSSLAAVVKSMDSPIVIAGLAKQILDKKDCVPSSVAFTVGYKLEEEFPASEMVDLSKKLYRKSLTCGKDLWAANSSFRLGLINVWQNQCEEVPTLMTNVTDLPEASNLHARADYWRFYCANAKGDEVGKRAAKLALFRDHPLSFHALAVSGEDDSSTAFILSTAAPQIAIRSLVRPDLNSTLRASEALIRAGAPQLGAEMIDRNAAEMATLEPETRLYIAVMLSRVGYSLPAFKVLTALFQDVPRMISQSTMRLFFPLAYYEIVKAKESQVDPLLLLSLIRQESAFNKEAHSAAGARGLMQVMPATARSVASMRAKTLFDPFTNVKIGTKFFLKRLGDFDGDVELTLAAYNAGANRVEQWRKRYPTTNKMLFLDFIPFKETREYVSSILRNYYWYVKLYTPSAIGGVAEGSKISVVDTKVLAIMNANAGAAAMLTDLSSRTSGHK